MTTTDARKRNRDTADAHETARARDAQTLHAYLTPADPQPGDEVIYLGPAYSTRTHAINPDTGEFARLDQETDTMTDHRIAAESLLDGELEDHADVSTLTSAAAHALLAIDDTLKDIAGNTAEQYAVLTEIRDRLPEAHDPVGSQCRRDYCEETHDPAPADVDPDEVLAKVLYHAVSPFDGGDDLVPWDEVTYRDVRDHWLGVARAAREHIERESMEAHLLGERDNTLVEDLAERAEKAETRLAAVTNERDKWNSLAHEADRNAKRHCDRADKAEADLARVTEERDGWRTKAQRIWNATHSWLATIEPDDGGSMKVTRGRRGALINTIDRHWWSEPFFNPESPMRDTERAES